MSQSEASDRWATTSISSVVRDERRLEALRAYNILDTEPEPSFDRITRLASHLLDAPTAIINLIDADRQWFKSTVGFDEDETGLDVSFCVYTVAAGEVFVVENLAEDDRFADNPYVTQHGVRFYAGAPLVAPEGERLGTICVLDTEPRSPSDEALDRLSDLAGMVVDELELRKEKAEHRRARHELEQNQELLRHAEELAEVGGWTYDPGADELTWTDETYRLHDLPTDHEIGVEEAIDFYTPESRPVIRSHVERLLDEGGRYDLELDIVTAEGERRRVRTIGEAHRSDGETVRVDGAIQDITERHRTERLKNAQGDFFERIAAGEPVEEVLGALCAFTEEELEEVVVSILRIEDNTLNHVAAPSVPANFIEAVDGSEIGPDVGTCGRAAFLNQTVITENIQADERWKNGWELAEEAGLRSCWSMPIRDEEGDVLGTFALYGSRPRTPTAEEKQLMEQMSHVASVALKRERSEQALRESEERFRTVVENAQPVVFMVDRDGTFLLSEGKDLQSLGLEPGEVVGESVYDLYEDVPGIIDGIERALKGEYIDNEVEVEGLFFDNWYSPIYDEDGTVTGVMGMAADVTDRKEAERELRETNQRLRLALEAANAGTFNFDLSSDQVLWDERSVELYGFEYEPEMRDADLVRDLVLDEDLDPLEETVGRAIEEGQERYDVTYRIRRADDGERRYIHSHGIILRDESGTAQRIIGINQDVTERRERAEQLRLLEAAVEHSLLTVLITEAEPLDEPGPRTVYANPAFTEMTGYDVEKVVGRSPRFLQGPDTDRAALDRIRAALERGEPVRETVRNYAKDGTPYWNDLFIAPVHDDGEVTHFVSVQNDVTERRRRKRKLERQNDLFAKAQDLASVGAWEYDVDAEEIMLTDEVYRIHGVTPDANLAPERSIDYYHPDDQATIREAFRRAVEEGEPYDLELRLITEEGEQRWVRTRGEPQREEGEIVRVRGTIQDVTERVQGRKELEAAKEVAEEGNRIKSALLSNMNHEFRTPLTSILTFSELIRDNPEVAERFVDRIIGGGRRLLYTLNTVMDFAELESRDLSVTPQPFHLGEVVRSVANDFQKQAREKGIDISIEVADGVGSVTLDQHLVERLLTHLVHNAVKFTDEGGVTIAVRADDVAEICVSDTGVGIDSDFLPHVFDEFAQQSSGYDRTYEGNGLGLTVVKQMVEAMEGTVDVESDVGTGTTVQVRLPMEVEGGRLEGER